MENIDHNGDASLEGMPTELFENIAEHLETKDLKSLRLVSRIVCTKVLRVYANTLFSDYSFFLFSEDSMVRALEIARHPAFGKSITKVSILCDRLKARERQTSRPTRLTSMIQKLIAEEDAFRENGGALSFLTTFFCVLSTHGKLKSVTITSGSASNRRPAGINPLFFQYEGLSFGRSRDFGTAVKTVIEALYLSNTKPLEFRLDDWDSDYITAEFFSPAHCLEVFSEVESLYLPWLQTKPDQILKWGAQFHWLAHAQRLKHVYLTEDGPALSCILRTRFAALETFTLQISEHQQEEVTLKELSDFARANPTLQALNLDCVDIYKCGEHFQIDDRGPPELADERDLERLQKILGIGGKYNSVCLR